MYLGVDIGGTKTLVAVLDQHGVIKEQAKFPTPANYKDFTAALAAAVAGLNHKEFKAAGVAAPGKIDRERGVAVNFGNLAWHNVPIAEDCEKLLQCPVLLENDANLAGLGEAMLHKDVETVLYITVSTGIGSGVIRNLRIDPTLADMEAGQMMMPFKGNLVLWEDFASGRAIYEHFNKKAMDIHDEASWKYVVHNLSLGFFELMAIVQPDLIIIGGSVGTYFDRYDQLLKAELAKFDNPLVPVPRIIQAKRPEVAVIYGCYDLIMQELPHHRPNQHAHDARGGA